MELSSGDTGGDAVGLKRTGRPVHPLWAHFHRGEKRNRNHYHAYCSYCVARLGAGQVPPTRGVSYDMLRHLESCPSCPRKVVDALKDICGKRARHAQARKQQALMDELSGDKLDHVLLLEPTAAAASAAPTEVAVATELQMEREAAKRRASEALGDEEAVETAPRVANDIAGKKSTTKRPSAGRIGDTSGYLTMPVKRGRTDSGRTEEIPVTKWQTGLLQAAVVAGIPLSAFQKSEFQELLHALSPVPVDNDVISNIGSQTFVGETAAKLARSQLDRVKEGMSNSTIKSGLTLSVTSWCTLDLQQLVAFTLVNANGDSSCVRVEDIGGHNQQRGPLEDDSSESPIVLLVPLANAIEDVLLELSEENVYVMGIVADSVVALSAAKKVCRNARWRSLLVVPCISALLTSLAGSVLTHELFRDSVGKLIELVAYFSNARLQASLSTICGEHDARIPLPTKEHWFSFVECLTKALHYSDAITAMCSSQEQGGSALAPLALRKLVLENNGQLWKILRELAVVLAPLREAYSLVFQPKPKVGEVSNGEENEQFTATVHGGLTLAHVMYQLGRMSQQYAALAESAEMGTVSTSSGSSNISAVAHNLHERLDFMWQRYDLPAIVLAFVFDFHLDTGRLDMSNGALQWKAVASYFQTYFHRWFCHPEQYQSSNSSPTSLEPISNTKVEGILNAYQLRQFPFDADTTNDYTDVSSFYSFVSDSHPEICALCCRVYAIALTVAEVRRVVRGIGFVPHVAQTVDRPEHVELLLHIGFASSLKKTKCGVNTASDCQNVLPELLQTSHPEVLLGSQDEWETFADDWSLLLEHERTVDELEQLQQLHEHDSRQDKEGEGVEHGDALRLPLDQLFFEALPPLPTAVVVAPSPHDPTGTVTQASVAL